MTATLGSRAAIVGIGQVINSPDREPLKTALQLGAEAAAKALGAAGIERRRIGAFFTARCPTSYRTFQYNQTLLNELKIAPIFNTELTAHGAGAIASLGYAAMAVNSGMVDYALCVTNDASPAWLGRFKVGSNALNEANLQFEAPYGPSTPSLYAQIACRYMHETGATPEMMAHVAVENRRWALDHPRAAMRRKGPITVDDVLSSRIIASPLRLLDCSINYPDGIATALVVARAEIARDAHDSPTWIAGFGHCSTHEWISERMGVWDLDPVGSEANLTAIGTVAAAEQAYGMAGLTPADMDLVQSSSPFTFANTMTIENLGFCKRGEGGDFVAGGGIAYDGGLPYNTSGGYLSFGQTAQGLYQLTETIDQIWGRAEGRQVQDAAVGLVHGHGGIMACHAVVIVSREPTRD